MKKTFRGKCIVLEGLPAAGKTSLANYLRDYHRFFKVNESLGYLGGANITDDQRLIFQETRDKYYRAVKEKLALIDRGYPSMLAWDYCTSKRSWANDLAEKKQWVQKALKKGELYEPDLYVYLKISPAQSLLRRPRRPSRKDVWSDKTGMLYCQEFYGQFFRKPNIAQRTLLISGDEPVHRIAAKILRALNE